MDNIILQINNIDEFKKIIGKEPYYGSPKLPFNQEEDYNQLNEFFKNKSVAIVGPAPDLISKNKGSEIDSFDIVCKVGHHYKINDSENYGKRMDVLFNSCLPIYNTNKCEYNFDYLNNNDIKRIICPIKPCIPGILDVHKRNIFDTYENIKKKNPNIYFNNISLFSCNIDNKINTRCTLGSFSIIFLLNMPIVKLGIYGFTWFQNKNSYNKEYHNIDKTVINPHGTDMKIEARYIKHLISKTNIKIQLSQEVKNILTLL